MQQKYFLETGGAVRPVRTVPRSSSLLISKLLISTMSKVTTDFWHQYEICTTYSEHLGDAHINYNMLGSTLLKMKTALEQLLFLSFITLREEWLHCFILLFLRMFKKKKKSIFSLFLLLMQLHSSQYMYRQI